jgi:NADPH:quinone reductase-like Zn-dependent oxidoreductase
VLIVGDMDDPEPGPGEVCIQVKDSGINPEAGWPGSTIDRRSPLGQAASAHEYLETRRGSGRVVLPA